MLLVVHIMHMDSFK